MRAERQGRAEGHLREPVVLPEVLEHRAERAPRGLRLADGVLREGEVLQRARAWEG